MTRIHARKRSRHGRNDRDRRALRGLFGALLLVASLGLVSIHGHETAPRDEASYALLAAGEDAPAPLHGHSPADLADCQICELSRRDEVEQGVPSANPFAEIALDRPVVGVYDLTSAPRAPTRGRPGPRAPPRFSV